jgi:uncharacterized membrane protein
MIDENVMILMEKYFENELSSEEEDFFLSQLSHNENLRKEFEDQKKIKEILNKMKMKDPSSELWDGYWEKTYNRIQRGLGWLAIFVGALILLAFASIEFVNQLYSDNTTPIVIKIGIVFFVFGFLVLIFSIIREKIFIFKSDKYKEIQR